MRWPPWSSNSDGERNDKNRVSWTDSLNATDWEHFSDPKIYVPALLLATGFTATYLVSRRLYKSYLRRIPDSGHINPGFFRRKSLFGTVTRVGDGDNFHLFHQPGGRLAGWGWFPGRRIPQRASLKGKTIAIRIAGVDAPEGAHFGKPAQPYSAEALEWLKKYILGRRVRAYIYRRDQYERVVATVYVRRGPFRRDVGMEMIARGLATVYEAKSGAEFGGLEERYKSVEERARRKKRGMWAAKKVESPREYKIRMADFNESKELKEKTIPGFWRRFIWWR